MQAPSQNPGLAGVLPCVACWRAADPSQWATGRPAPQVVAASMVGPLGGWRGAHQRLQAGVGEAREATDSAEARRLQQRMSKGAILAQAALKTLLLDAGCAGWEQAREEIGYFLGVGASGGSVEQFERMMAVSVEGDHWSMARFGGEGLRACNPLYAFQLMNNFTMCHGAITYGLGGPNGALFSRGFGTFLALLEGLDALDQGLCERVVVGGADSALHPVTRLELGPRWASEGAGLLGLSMEQGLAEVRAAACVRVLEGDGGPALDAIFGVLDPSLERVLSCASPAQAEALGASDGLWDTSGVVGGALAAAPSMLWCVALDRVSQLQAGEGVCALSYGSDGYLVGVELRKGLRA